MVFKRIMAILFSAIMLCSSLTASAYAETTSAFVDGGITPAYEIAGNPRSILDISGKTAYCTSSTNGNGAVSITIEQTLEKQGFLWIWGDVKDASWTKTVSKNSITFDNSKGSLSNGKYRVKSVFTLTDSKGTTETFTIYSAEKTVG